MDTPTTRLALECYPIYLFYYLWSKQHPITWQYIGIRLVITHKVCIMKLMTDNVVVKHLDTWQYIVIRLVITYYVCIMTLMISWCKHCQFMIIITEENQYKILLIVISLLLFFIYSTGNYHYSRFTFCLK